ncbi:MAG: CBM35 domain-containing protein [Cyclobacteriaceae bacterium]
MHNQNNGNPGLKTVFKAVFANGISPLLLLIGLLSFNLSQAQVFTYEAEDGTRSGSSIVVNESCGDCSVAQVENISPGNFFTSTVNVTYAGQYTLTLSYASGDPRSIFISVNGGNNTELVCDSGDWGTIWTSKVEVNLNAGSNTIAFSNESGFGPNIDKFTLKQNPMPGMSVEAESGTTAGNAESQSCNTCSGGNQIGNIGGNSGNYLENTVNVSKGGLYNMTLSYSSGDARSVFIRVGSGEAVEVIGHTRDWGVVGTKKVSLTLAEGDNVIRFFNDNNFAPNLDKFELVRDYSAGVSYEAEAGTLTGNAAMQGCEACSGGQQVGDISSGNFFTNTVNVSEAGSYVMKLSFVSGDPRSIFVSVNDGDAVELNCYSGDWDLVNTTEVSLKLNAGDNTIKFFNDGGNGPNIDKFELEEKIIAWYGNVNTNWGTQGNWDGGELPTSSENVLVPDANALVVSGDFAVKDIIIESTGKVDINSGASLAIFGTAIGGNSSMTVSRNSKGNQGYSILGAPVEGATVDDLSADYLYTFNESNGMWEVPTGNMTAGKGYFVGYNTSDASVAVSITGAPVVGSQTAAISSGGTGAGFNLVANPYTAAISMSKFLSNTTNANSTTGAIYLWDDGNGNNGSDRGGDYIVVNSLGVTVNTLNDSFDGTKTSTPAENGYIGTMQGFFVEASGSGSTVQFEPDMQDVSSGANSDNNFYRKANDKRQLLKLSLSGNGLYNETLVGLTADATFDKDYSLDAKKFSNNEKISFYSMIEDERYAIQGLPQVSGQPIELELGMDLSESGNYVIGVEQFEAFDGMVVRLIDNMTGQSHNLSNDSKISFTTGTTSFAKRFSLVFAPAGVLAVDNLSSKLKVFGGVNELNINFDSENTEAVSIYTLNGQLMFRDKVTFSNGKSVINPSLNNNEVYILKVDDQAIKFVIQ